VEDLHQHPSGRILVHKVTQLEISSTELRNIVAAGTDPRYLVPDPVRDVIQRTGCYTHPSER
jgi:nicotinate-nucleotide adenylyltransferase